MEERKIECDHLKILKKEEKTKVNYLYLINNKLFQGYCNININDFINFLSLSALFIAIIFLLILLIHEFVSSLNKNTIRNLKSSAPLLYYQLYNYLLTSKIT